MRAIRQWLTSTLPQIISAWMLPNYRRPLGFLIGLGVVPLGIILLVAYQLNVSLWRTQALHNLHVTARLASRIIEETLSETVGFERAVAAQPEFLQHLQLRDRAGLRQDMERVLALMPRTDFGMVLSLEAEVLAVYPEHPELIGAHRDQDEAFQGSRSNGWEPYVSGVYLREGPEIEKVVSVILPVRQGDTVLGLLQLQHRVEEIKSWLQKIRIEPEGFLYVVDQHNQLVVHPLQVLPGRPKVVADWPPVAQPLSEQGTTMTFRHGAGGQFWLAGIHPVGELGWRVVAVQPQGAALQAFRRVFWTLAGLIGTLMVVVLILSLGWVRMHMMSLRLLRQNAKLIRQLQQKWLRNQGQGKGPEG